MTGGAFLKWCGGSVCYDFAAVLLPCGVYFQVGGCLCVVMVRGLMSLVVVGVVIGDSGGWQVPQGRRGTSLCCFQQGSVGRDVRGL